MNMKKYRLIIVTVFFFFTVSAQQQNSPLIQWRQIKTNNFTVIFPKEIENRGIETAQILETAYKPTRNSLRIATPKTTVLLYNQSSISNGYTAVAPYRMVFYTTPPQDALMVGGTDWLKTLTVHEYRHAVQYAKLNNNLNYFMGSLFGDLGRGVFMNISVPEWVFEGDAVCTETAFSLEGRGRLPSFTRDIRALELENTRYSYYKAYLGSYNDYFPDHYHLGYMMTSHIRSTYGDSIWNKVLTRTTKFSFSPWTFSRSLKKYTGFSMNKTYRNCFNEYKNTWEEKSAQLEITPVETVSLPIRSSYTNYSYPYFTTDNKIIAVKSGMDGSPELVLLNNGIEKKLTKINPIDRVHSNGSLVVWSTEKAAIRWGERSFSDIFTYNLNTGKKKYITHRSKYYAPAISPDGLLIAAVKYDKTMICQLDIIDVNNGKVKLSYSFKDDEFIRMPSWSADGSKVVFTLSKGQVRNISYVDIKSGIINNITDFSTESLTNPVFFKDYVLYNTCISGIDAINAISLLTKEHFVVVIGKYGVYNPSVSADSNKIVFQNYTTLGKKLGSLNSDPSVWKKADNEKNYGDNYYQHLVKLENGISIFDSLKTDTTINYKVKKYHPLMHSVQIHSWAPYAVNNGVGFGVLSTDKLNTTSIMAGVNYFPEATAHREFISLLYSRFFPQFELMASYGRRYDIEDKIDGTSEFRPTDEKLLRAGIILPLNFSRSIHTVILELNAAYNSIYYKRNADGSFADSLKILDDVTAMEYGLKFVYQQPMSIRDLNPRFGITALAKYWNTPFNEGTEGERLVGHLEIYLPGLYKHHSITLKGAYEASSANFRKGIYALTSSAEFSRGYDHYISEVFRKKSIEYTLPIAYPDLALGPILYCKRIWGNLFYDYGKLDWKGETYLLRSVGVDLNFTLHFFNFLQIPIEMGLRTTYLIEDEKYTFEFLLFSAAF
jgi:hypothetical protein